MFQALALPLYLALLRSSTWLKEHWFRISKRLIADSTEDNTYSVRGWSTSRLDLCPSVSRILTSPVSEYLVKPLPGSVHIKWLVITNNAIYRPCNTCCSILHAVKPMHVPSKQFCVQYFAHEHCRDPFYSPEFMLELVYTVTISEVKLYQTVRF